MPRADAPKPDGSEALTAQMGKISVSGVAAQSKGERGWQPSQVVGSSTPDSGCSAEARVDQSTEEVAEGYAEEVSRRGLYTQIGEWLNSWQMAAQANVACMIQIVSQIVRIATGDMRLDLCFTAFGGVIYGAAVPNASDMDILTLERGSSRQAQLAQQSTYQFNQSTYPAFPPSVRSVVR